MPSDAVQFLTADEVLAIHERLIDLFGGPPGVRDLGLLESALHRPRTGYYRDLSTMAAALLVDRSVVSLVSAGQEHRIGIVRDLRRPHLDE